MIRGHLLTRHLESRRYMRFRREPGIGGMAESLRSQARWRHSRVKRALECGKVFLDNVGGKKRRWTGVRGFDYTTA
ncbi:hypothetical protein RCIP0075_00050 [Klebsiella phage RCIP0075]